MRNLTLTAIVVLSGCASWENPPPRPYEFEPIKKAQFKSDGDRQIAEKVSRAKCKAYAMQVAAGAPPPTMPQRTQVNINVQPAPGYGYPPGPALQQPYIPDSGTMIAAQQAGAAARFQNDLFLSSAIGCMAKEGWIVKE